MLLHSLVSYYVLFVSPLGTPVGFYGRDYVLSCSLPPNFFFLAFSCHSHLSLKITTPKKRLLTFQDEVVSSPKPPQHIILYFTIPLPCLSSTYQLCLSIFFLLSFLSLSLSSPLLPSPNIPIRYLFIFIHCFFCNSCLSPSTGVYVSQEQGICMSVIHPQIFE